MGTLWGFHPYIVHHFIDATILPVLFCTAPVWYSAIRWSVCLVLLDYVLWHCAICALGLLRIVSGDVARVLARILPAEFYLRRRVVDFYLRHLSYGEDLLVGAPVPPVVNSSVSCGDIF